MTHVLAGEDAGPAKIAKAEELGIKIINEDEFLKLIKERSNKNHEDTSQKNKSKIKIEKTSAENHVRSKKSPKDDKLPIDNRYKSIKKERSVSPEKEKTEEKSVKVKKEKHSPVKKERKENGKFFAVIVNYEY